MINMRKNCIFGLVLFCMCCCAASVYSSTIKTHLKMYKIEVPFVKNLGQVNEQVAFYATTFNGSVFITRKGEIQYILPKIDNDKMVRNSIILTEYLLNAELSNVEGKEPSETKVNYFKGKDPGKWRRNIPSFRKVSFGKIYPGIELILKAKGKNIEKIFTISPGANVSSISLRIEGGNKIWIAADGTLKIETSMGKVSFTKPIAYQEIEGKKYNVEVSYVLLGQSKYGFRIKGQYDPTKALIIDPLLASTYFGGNNEDTANALAVASDGSIYITGRTFSNNLSLISNGYQMSNGGGEDGYICRLSGDLTQLLASTYIGGTEDDDASNIAVASDGSVYITGWTSSDNFPIVGNAYQTVHKGKYDVFVSRLSGDLSQLLASTYIGGSDQDVVVALAIAINNSVYIAGNTESKNFPVTIGAYQTECNGDKDTFVSRLSGDLSQLLASTYIGGNHWDYVGAMSVAPNGNIYIAGWTYSDFPVTADAYQNKFAGWTDAFVSCLSDDLSQLLASTYVGGYYRDHAGALFLAPDGSVYVAGDTESDNFPVTAGVYQDKNEDKDYDAFICHLSEDLSELLASTYLGGKSADWIGTIVISSSGKVYVSGGTSSTDFPLTADAYQSKYGGGYIDGFVSCLSDDLSQLLASTYIGGSDVEWNNALSIVSEGNMYIAGWTSSNDFPTTTNAYQINQRGHGDSFISHLTFSSLAPSVFYTLAVTKHGSGFGTVASSPTGVDCGNVCSGQFISDTSITLTASPNSESILSSWENDCASCKISRQCPVVMKGNISCSAKFDKISEDIFNDVSSTSWAFKYINALYKIGITSGCSTSPLRFCPDDSVTRAQMAIFILRAMGAEKGSCTGKVFSDVDASHWACGWIEKFAELGITRGCHTDDPNTPENEARYCPDSPITRAQMAVFLMKALNHTPSSKCTGSVFEDVSISSVGDGFCKYIEGFADMGITAGCSANPPLYCPNDVVTRAQMAVFLTKAYITAGFIK